MKLAGLLLKAGIDIRPRLFQDILAPLGGQLKHIICGGAFLDQKYIDDFYLWGIDVLAGYGITECSPVASVNRGAHVKRGSAGQLVKGLQAKISDEGEILLKGDMIFQGYYNNQQETAAALKDGWFHTGDLGWIDQDGFLFLTGRSKNLIITANGENISPEQIEMELMRLEGISEAVVYEDQGRIFAQIYPEDDDGKDDGYFLQLIDTFNQQRPMDHQIQKVIVRKTPFEKNASQKIIRSSFHKLEQGDKK